MILQASELEVTTRRGEMRTSVYGFRTFQVPLARFRVSEPREQQWKPVPKPARCSVLCVRGLSWGGQATKLESGCWVRAPALDRLHPNPDTCPPSGPRRGWLRSRPHPGPIPGPNWRSFDLKPWSLSVATIISEVLGMPPSLVSTAPSPFGPETPRLLQPSGGCFLEPELWPQAVELGTDIRGLPGDAGLSVAGDASSEKRCRCSGEARRETAVGSGCGLARSGPSDRYGGPTPAVPDHIPSGDGDLGAR